MIAGWNDGLFLMHGLICGCYCMIVSLCQSYLTRQEQVDQSDRCRGHLVGGHEDDDKNEMSSLVMYPSINLSINHTDIMAW